MNALVIHLFYDTMNCYKILKSNEKVLYSNIALVMCIASVMLKQLRQFYTDSEKIINNWNTETPAETLSENAITYDKTVYKLQATERCLNTSCLFISDF